MAIKNPVKHSLDKLRLSFLYSVKFGIIIISLLILASISGTLYEDLDIAVSRIYGAWWHKALLILFAVNISASSLIILSCKIIPAMKARFLTLPEDYKCAGISGSYRCKAKISDIEKAFLKSGFGVSINREFGFAHKGIVSYFGSTISHAGLILIIAGGLLTSLFYKEGVIRLDKNEKTDFLKHKSSDEIKIPLGFAILCEEFIVEHYPKSNMPSEFMSRLIISEPGKEDKKVELKVNKPFYYKGYKFYQSGFEESETNPDGYITIIRANKNPMLWLIYTGCVLKIIGVGLAFFVRRRQVWFHLDEEAQTLLIAAVYKFPQKNFDNLTQKVIDALTQKNGDEDAEI